MESLARSRHGHCAALALALTMPSAIAQPAEPCFDVSAGVIGPLRPPIELSTDGADTFTFGTYADGTDWASARAIVPMPLARSLAKLRDPRNLKDMKKTRLVVRPVEGPEPLDLRLLDVEVTLRALLLKATVKWTEEWAFLVLDGTSDTPRHVVANYRKIDGTSHIRHHCGSYVLRAHGNAATDFALYEEIQAKRRSAEDTRDMQAGILRNIREDRFDAAAARDDPRVRFAPGAPPRDIAGSAIR